MKYTFKKRNQNIKRKNKNTRKINIKRKKSNKTKQIKYGGSDLPMNYMSFSLDQALTLFNDILQQKCIRNNMNNILYLTVVNKDGFNALCLNIVTKNTPLDESQQILTRGKRMRPEYEYIHTCISQINMDVDENAMIIDSKTKDVFKRYNLNTLLRALVILLGNKIESNARYLVSYPSNYLSAYSLISKFNGIPYDENGNKMNISMLKTVDDYSKFYTDYQIKENDKFVSPISEVRVDFGYKNMKKAYDIFISKITCDVLNL
jgi:hypothetical protein